MRVVSNIPASVVTTTFQPESSDRHVPLNVFVPKTVPVPSAPQRAHNEYIIDAIKLLIWQAFDPTFGLVDFKPRQPALQGIKSVIALSADKTKIPAKSSPERARLLSALRGLNSAASEDEIIRVTEVLSADAALLHHFDSNSAAPKSKRGAKQRGAKPSTGVKNCLSFQNYLPPKYGTDSSEIGYLFLDRTRCRQIGFEVGEHIDTLALGPGEEAVFEVRTSRKESTSLEDTLEREFETTLEQTSHDSQTQTTTDQQQSNQSSTSSSSLSPSGGASIPVEVAKVDASLNANSSNTFTEAANNSSQNSVTIATQNSRRATSKLRQNHRVTLKTGVETGIETLSRRVIKNPNSATPISLHYFKIMQKVEMQQERMGVRLCWAPFVHDPGGHLRTQARLAREAIFAEARRNVEIPPEPVPPKKEMAAFWKESDEEIVAKTPIGRFVDSFTLSVKIGTGEICTGRANVIKSGSGADRAELTVLDIPEAPDEDGYVSVDVLVFSDADLLRLGDTCRVKLRVEVLRQLPGYDQKQIEYQRLLEEHRQKVKQVLNTAVAKAKPAADAAAAKVLATADVRAELIGAIVRQYIELLPSGEALEIDFWHRMIDFDNVSFSLYPGWWRKSWLPYPSFNAQHFLNAELARVFLPIREGYEEQFLNCLYQSKQQPVMNKTGYNNLVNKFVRALRSEQRKYLDKNKVPISKAMGPVWTEYVPTNGTHIEVELSATTAADLVTERQIEASAARLEADIAAITEENNIRQNASAAAAPQVVVGPIT